MDAGPSDVDEELIPSPMRYTKPDFVVRQLQEALIWTDWPTFQKLLAWIYAPPVALNPFITDKLAIQCVEICGATPRAIECLEPFGTLTRVLNRFHWECTQYYPFVTLNPCLPSGLLHSFLQTVPKFFARCVITPTLQSTKALNDGVNWMIIPELDATQKLALFKRYSFVKHSCLDDVPRNIKVFFFDATTSELDAFADALIQKMNHTGFARSYGSFYWTRFVDFCLPLRNGCSLPVAEKLVEQLIDLALQRDSYQLSDRYKTLPTVLFDHQQIPLEILRCERLQSDLFEILPTLHQWIPKSFMLEFALKIAEQVPDSGISAWEAGRIPKLVPLLPAEAQDILFRSFLTSKQKHDLGHAYYGTRTDSLSLLCLCFGYLPRDLQMKAVTDERWNQICNSLYSYEAASKLENIAKTFGGKPMEPEIFQTLMKTFVKPRSIEHPGSYDTLKALTTGNDYKEAFDAMETKIVEEQELRRSPARDLVAYYVSFAPEEIRPQVLFGLLDDYYSKGLITTQPHFDIFHTAWKWGKLGDPKFLPALNLLFESQPPWTEIITPKPDSWHRHLYGPKETVVSTQPSNKDLVTTQPSDVVFVKPSDTPTPPVAQTTEALASDQNDLEAIKLISQKIHQDKNAWKTWHEIFVTLEPHDKKLLGTHLVMGEFSSRCFPSILRLLLENQNDFGLLNDEDLINKLMAKHIDQIPYQSPPMFDDFSGYVIQPEAITRMIPLLTEAQKYEYFKKVILCIDRSRGIVTKPFLELGLPPDLISLIIQITGHQGPFPSVLYSREKQDRMVDTVINSYDAKRRYKPLQRRGFPSRYLHHALSLLNESKKERLFAHVMNNIHTKTVQRFDLCTLIDVAPESKWPIMVHTAPPSIPFFVSLGRDLYRVFALAQIAEIYGVPVDIIRLIGRGHFNNVALRRSYLENVIESIPQAGFCRTKKYLFPFFKSQSLPYETRLLGIEKLVQHVTRYDTDARRLFFSGYPIHELLHWYLGYSHNSPQWVIGGLIQKIMAGPALIVTEIEKGEGPHDMIHLEQYIEGQEEPTRYQVPVFWKTRGRWDHFLSCLERVCQLDDHMYQSFGSNK